MKLKFFILGLFVAGAVLVGRSLTNARIYNPSAGGTSSVASGTVLSLGSPLVIGGANSSTITGDGTTSTFGGAISAANLGENNLIFSNGGVLTNLLEGTYSSTTGQTKFTGQAGLNYGASITTGAVVNATCTNTTSTCFEVTSNQGASQAGRMVVFNQQNAAVLQDMIVMINNASGSTALNVQSFATGKGGIKCEQKTTGGDANAACLSIDTGNGGGGTLAQGARIDATNGGTSGPQLTVLNNGKQMFQVISNSSTTTSTSAIFGASNVSGCLELQDTTGTTKYYLTIVATALQVTSTKPSICN